MKAYKIAVPPEELCPGDCWEYQQIVETEPYDYDHTIVYFHDGNHAIVKNGHPYVTITRYDV
jgi:hypothetical protein